MLMNEYDKETDTLVIGMSPARVPAGEFGIVLAITKPDGTTLRVDGGIGLKMHHRLTSQEFQMRYITPILHALQARLTPDPSGA